MEAIFDFNGFQHAVEDFAEATEANHHDNEQEYKNAQQTLAGRCANIIVTAFDSAWAAEHPVPAAPVPVANANNGSNASSVISVSSGGSQGGGRRARKTRRRNISNMSWLRRRVNSLTLKNLQREENRLSEEEDRDMPGRGWAHTKKARKTRRRRA